MLLQFLFLFIIFSSTLAQECQTPNVAVLPGSSFSATSAYSDSFKASNVRFAIENPWCPATFDSDNEYVTVDLQCARSVRQVEGKDPHLLFYNGEYSNDNVNWEKLESEDETHYSPYLGFEANNRAVITPPVRARYFRFRLSMYAGGFDKPCFKVELYGKNDDSVEPLGCFNEKGRRKYRAMPVTFHSVQDVDTNFPDILAIYEECRQKAAEYSKFEIEVFGIKNYRKCVTTATGKEEQYSKHGKSSKCAVCGGKGIGTRRTSMFVYQKKL